jgi:hypothetical protein
MLNTHLRKLSKTPIHLLVAGAALALPVMRLQAQPAALADVPAGYQVSCSIQDSSGFRGCDEQPSARSCDAEANYASRPSNESTGIAFVNRGDKPVKVYWLNFQGERKLYNKYLAPGAKHTQQTFVGHNWLITTLTEQCIGIYTTAPQPIVGDVSVTDAPPEIPVYDQPPPPQDNLIWTPGYWAWNEEVGDYYWMQGTWVAAPIVGYLWTPGYWIVERGAFAWREGYWGPHVGFYGGINYGHGYFGRGFVGGSWRDGRMMYNSAVTTTFQSTNVYNEPMARKPPISRVSYNGGGGISTRPNAAELAAASEIHIPPTAAQLQQLHTAHDNPAMRARLNGGHPSTDTASRPGESSSASIPPGHHAGTLSIMHSASPPRPARTVGTAEPSRTLPAASTSPRTPQPQSHVAQAPAEQPAPQETQKRQPDASQTRPRTMPHPPEHPP